MGTLVLQPRLMVGSGWDHFALLDSGHGRKLERYGAYRFIRPEPQALWQPRGAEWDAHGEFGPGADEDGGGRWAYGKAVPKDGWPLAWGEVDTLNQERVVFPSSRHIDVAMDNQIVLVRGVNALGKNDLREHGANGGGNQGAVGRDIARRELIRIARTQHVHPVADVSGNLVVVAAQQAGIRESGRT